MLKHRDDLGVPHNSRPQEIIVQIQPPLLSACMLTGDIPTYIVFIIRSPMFVPTTIVI